MRLSPAFITVGNAFYAFRYRRHGPSRFPFPCKETTHVVPGRSTYRDKNQRNSGYRSPHADGASTARKCCGQGNPPLPGCKGRITRAERMQCVPYGA